MFVATKKTSFVATKVCLLRHAYFCHNRRVLLWQTCVCHDKHMFVMTKLLSRQKRYLCQLLPMMSMGCFVWVWLIQAAVQYDVLADPVLVASQRSSVGCCLGFCYCCPLGRGRGTFPSCFYCVLPIEKSWCAHCCRLERERLFIAVNVLLIKK